MSKSHTTIVLTRSNTLLSGSLSLQKPLFESRDDERQWEEEQGRSFDRQQQVYSQSHIMLFA